VLRDLLVRGALSRKLALCMLMVDFTNPVFSSRRATLLRHVPQAIALGEGQDLDRRFVGSVRVSSEANTQGSPEGEFLAMWDRADWEANLADRVNRYWTSIGSVLSSAEGFDQVFRLAESRRRQFRKRPVLEFGLTLAAAIKMALPRKLQMTDDAQVEEGTAFEESADGPI